MQDTLARKLRVLRAERGLTLREAEHLTGVDKDTLSKLERGLRHPYDVTLSKLAKGYSVPVEELLEEPAPSRPQPFSRESDLFEGGWREAFDNSLRVRADAKERLRERLELWEAAREEGAGEEIRRELLDEVGRILDETNEAVGKLLENVSDGLDGMADPSPEGRPNAYWEEVRKIDTLYRELVAMVRDAGLSVRSKTPGDTAWARRHELEALAR